MSETKPSPGKMIENASYFSQLTLLEQGIENSRKPIIDLTYGYPDGLAPNWMRAYFDDINADKLDSLTVSVLKKTLTDYFVDLFAWDQIHLTNTASEALLIAFSAVIEDARDEIILLDNGFDCYPGLISMCKGVPVFAQRDQFEKMSVNEVLQLVTKKTKAILVTQPENPLGHIHSKTKFEELIDYCQETNITLIVDYAFLQVSPWGKEVPIISKLQISNRLPFILIGDTGKIIGLHGVRMGAILSSSHFTQRIAKNISNLLFRFSSQKLAFFASILTDSRLPQYVKDLNNTVSLNHKFMQTNLHPMLKLYKNEATSVSMLSINALGVTDLAFVRGLLENSQVGLAPGCMFYKSDREIKQDRVRIALGRTKADIRNAVERINSFVDQFFVLGGASSGWRNKD